MLVFLPIVGSGSTGTQRYHQLDMKNTDCRIYYLFPVSLVLLLFPEGNIWLSSFQPLHCGSLQLCLLTVCGSGSAQRVSRELQTWCERKTRHKALRSRGELQIWVMVLCHYDNTALFSHSESDVSNCFSVKITSM